MNDLRIQVIEVKGTCPVYKIGQSIYLKGGYELDVKNSSNICMHSLASILPYYTALSKGIKPAQLGLARASNKDVAVVQCLDPCQYTGGGTVIFQIEILE